MEVIVARLNLFKRSPSLAQIEIAYPSA